MKRRAILASIVGVVGSVSGCSEVFERSSDSFSDGIIEWTSDVSGLVTGQIHHSNGRLFLSVGSSDNQIISMRPSDGEIVWSTSTESPATSPPTVANGSVYVGLRRNIQAFDQNTGEESWRQPLGGRIRTTPQFQTDIVYVASGDGTLHAFDEPLQEKLWEVDIGGNVWGHPRVQDGTIYFSVDGLMYAVGTNGQIASTVLLSGKSYSRVGLGPQRLYAGAGASLHAIDLSTMERDWRFDFRNAAKLFVGPMVGEDIVYATGFDGFVYAIDAASGEKQWEFEVGSPIKTRPCVTDGSVYFSAQNNTVYALNRSDGTPHWKVSTDAPVEGAPLTVDGTVYVGDSEGTVYAVSGP